MWDPLRRALLDIWRRLAQGRSERRSAELRARFWSEVREGEREAEAAAVPERRDPLET